MNKIIFSFLIAASALYSNPRLMKYSHKEKIENGHFVLTYLNSGTHWTTNIIQIMNRNPIRFLELLGLEKTHNLFEKFNLLNLELDDSKPILYRTHEACYIPKKINPSKSKLLMVLRNYKECLPSVFNWNQHQLLQAIQKDHRDYGIYMTNLEYFDNWKDPHTKLLIYYEDLISNPREEIEKLASFFNISSDKVEEFFQHYDEWKIQVLNAYRIKQSKQAASGGNKLIFHSKGFSLEILREIDRLVKSKYPHLWEKYLSRYASK